jgi:hypothetical protein
MCVCLADAVCCMCMYVQQVQSALCVCKFSRYSLYVYVCSASTVCCIVYVFMLSRCSLLYLCVSSASTFCCICVYVQQMQSAVCVCKLSRYSLLYVCVCSAGTVCCICVYVQQMQSAVCVCIFSRYSLLIELRPVAYPTFSFIDQFGWYWWFYSSLPGIVRTECLFSLWVVLR